MFDFHTSLSKRGKYSNLCVFLTDLESDTQWGRDHLNLIEAFVYSEFDMLRLTVRYLPGAHHPEPSSPIQAL